jgi:hypothetical protein
VVAALLGRLGYRIRERSVERLWNNAVADGSSPSEGTAKTLLRVGAFAFRPICSASNVQWVEPFMERSRSHSRIR